MKKAIIYSITTAIIFLGCTKDNSNTLSDPINPVGLVTYNNNVKTIVDNNCIRCHGNIPTNGAPFSLTTYADVKSRIITIKDRISRPDGSNGIMPDGGPRLPQTTIDIIFKWQADGLIQ
ncbi:hypothetical protein [Flavobacterium sp.]|uniref:hypothetical protein n=1 Tax=Flavobacterium sp. TaxID=239 RepID=UPI00286AA77E|nr:hypothetical protein [Flavobacterium sp.]